MKLHRLIGFRKDRFVNFIETTFGVEDQVLIEKLHDQMTREKKNMWQLLEPCIVKLITEQGLVGDYTVQDLEDLIQNFKEIIQDLEKKLEVLKKNVDQ